MTTDAQINRWAHEAENKFGFLKAEGYQGPIRDLDSSWGTLTYLGSDLGVRLEVETDGFFMFVALFLPDNPEHDASLYLQEGLRRLGIQNSAISRVHELRGDFVNLSEMLSVFAEVLQSNIVALQARRTELFPS